MTKEQQPLDPVLMAQCVAAAMVGSIPIYMVVGVAVVWSGTIETALFAPSTARVLALVFLLAGAASALASYQRRRIMEARLPSSGGVLQDRLRIVLVSMILAECTGVLGLVYALLTCTLEVAGLLWAMSLIAAIIQFPTRVWLEKGSRK